MNSLAWACFQLSAVITAIKLLLVSSYFSTDFEVHRNWLAITHSLPLSQWYVDATSKWTLDYPPLFAWFEWALSHLAKFADPAMLTVTNIDFVSIGTVLFQRGSVIVSDLALLTAAYALARDVALWGPGEEEGPAGGEGSHGDTEVMKGTGDAEAAAGEADAKAAGKSQSNSLNARQQSPLPPPQPQPSPAQQPLRSTQLHSSLREQRCRRHRRRRQRWFELSGAALFFLLSCEAGLLLVDHMHFQYNGVMMGLLLWSLHAARTRRPLLSGLLFAVLLNLKHLFLFAAPAYFVALLRHHVRNCGPCCAAADAGSGAGTAPAAGGYESCGGRSDGSACGGSGGGCGGGRDCSGTGCVATDTVATDAATSASAAAATAAATAASAAATGSGGGRGGCGGAVSGGGGAGAGASSRGRSGTVAASLSGGSGMAAACRRLALLGCCVGGVFAASLGPWIAMGQAGQVMGRLFPWSRGLIHPVFPPNIWSLYAVADRTAADGLWRLAVECRRGPSPGKLWRRWCDWWCGGGGQRDLALLALRAKRAAAQMPGGDSCVTRFAVLPQVPAWVCAALVLAAQLPCLAALWAGDGRPAYLRRTFARALSYSLLCGFMYGYHVHEKWILMALLPLAADSVRCRAAGRRFLLLAAAGHQALLPLLWRPNEYATKIALVVSYHALAHVALAAVHSRGDGDDGGSCSGGGRCSDGDADDDPGGNSGGGGPPGSDGTEVEPPRVANAATTATAAVAAAAARHALDGVRQRGHPPPPQQQQPLLGPLDRCYLVGFVALEVCCSWILPYVLPYGLSGRVHQLALLAGAVYGFGGVAAVWGDMAAEWAREAYAAVMRGRR